MNRQEQNRARMASMRASEQTGNRQDQNRLHKVNVRASETQAQTVNRQEQNRLHQARKRALETPCNVKKSIDHAKEARMCL